MTVGILVITHGLVGHSLIEAACDTLGHCPLPTESLSITSLCSNTEHYRGQASKLYDQIDSGNGVIVLTDIFGATPSNIAHTLLEKPRSLLITGVNLPMIIRIMNYHHLPLNKLADKALTGAHDGTFQI